MLGDSIFDNAAYVPREAPVVEQLREALPRGWEVTLLAVDGASTAEVVDQLEGLHDGATHVFVSVGGNDALNESGVLALSVATVAEAELMLARSQAKFRMDYEDMTDRVLGLGRPAVFCTIYDAMPGVDSAARVALSVFNDVILRTAFRAHAPVIDLRLLCSERSDYSAISPIEPSAKGGAKIARLIAQIATGHDFSSRQTVVYP